MSDLGGSSSGSGQDSIGQDSSGQDSSTEELRGFGVGTRSVSGRIVRIGKQPPLIEGRNSGEASEGNDSAQVDSAFGDSDSIEFEGRDALRSRLSEMLEVVGIELETLGQNAPSEVADILEAQAMMAQDPTLVDRLLANVEPDPMVDAKCQLQRRNLRAAFEKVAAELRSVGGYIGERADDIGEIGARVADHLFGSADSQAIDEPNVNSILLFDQLTAAQASTLEPSSIKGVIVATGGPSGHATLILRSLDIPAVVGCPRAYEIPDGAVVLLDPLQGVVTIGANGRVPTSAHRPTVGHRSPKSVLATKAVQLLANVGSLADAQEARSQGAEGIGLVRTEFLFEGKEREPSVDEQVSTYHSLIEPFCGTRQPVIVRTLDVGSDKPLPFVNLAHEDNPALGVRGFRLVTQVPGLLERQLQALARTRALVNEVDFRVMAPMISSIGEAHSFMKMGRSAGLAPLGIMIEVPALALDFFRVAPLVDFASIGTNDLMQYLMGTDRNASMLGKLLDPWNPVALRLIKAVAREGARAKVAVSVCGEAAGDPLLAIVLVGLGITSLSMTPVALSQVRETLDAVSLTRARHLAQLAIRQLDSTAARQVVSEAIWTLAA